MRVLYAKHSFKKYYCYLQITDTEANWHTSALRSHILKQKTNSQIFMKALEEQFGCLAFFKLV